ncbi:MAG: phosphotransferase, partial [bacterium]
MATYTDLSRSDLEAFLQHYNIGKLLDFRPVSGGVQNSTYALTAQTAEKASIQGYFLSILEDIDQAQVEFTLGLCRYLSQAGLPVATSIKSNDSTLYHRIFDKPAALYPKIPGTHPDSPNVACCEQIASFLGKMHKTGVNFGETLPNRFDRAWLRSTIAALLPT